MKQPFNPEEMWDEAGLEEELGELPEQAESEDDVQRAFDTIEVF